MASGAGELEDAAGVSIRELLAMAEDERPHNLSALLPQLDRLVSLIRARAACDEDTSGAHGEVVGEREDEPAARGVLCSRCVGRVLQRDRLRAYEQANDQCAMRYGRWLWRACEACAGSCARLASTEPLPARPCVLQPGSK